MDLSTFELATKIQKRIKEIDFQLALLANEHDSYIYSIYDKNGLDELDENPENPLNNNQRVNLFKIEGELKVAIKDSLFKEKQKLEKQFKEL